ncbi:MAG: hypothetical protein MN733_25185 [Nitrososphaera sp.]|nr:hypothetical protein [Nitrososphaera sp.]
MESATGQYMPKIQGLVELRKRELSEMRAKVSSNPEKLERCFDKVIEKVTSGDVIDLVQNSTKQNATAGI